jgi:hypothetical protein
MQWIKSQSLAAEIAAIAPLSPNKGNKASRNGWDFRAETIPAS